MSGTVCYAVPRLLSLMSQMGAMGGSIIPSIGHVRLTDLVASEGLPSDSYKISVSTLAQSLAQYSAAVIEFPPGDSALLRSGLESARLFFHQHAYTPTDIAHMKKTREWCKTSGYYADPILWQETYDYRPGLTPVEAHGAMEFTPGGLPDIFAILGKAARDILHAINFSLNLRSFSFGELLDNMPLRNGEISSSVLSVCCHSRPSFQAAQHHAMTAQEGGQMIISPDHDIDKALITLVKSDRAGMRVKDIHGRWILVDGDLGPQDAVVYPGLALYQATAGYVKPSVHRMDIASSHAHIDGRSSVVFKLMPRSMASLSCSEMRAAGYGVEGQFQIPISVDEFMRRPHSTATLKPGIKRERGKKGRKSLPPSKKLRLEAQRVLKERVQVIAEKKGVKLRFCNVKECEHHMISPDSPCGKIRMEIGWPPGVPFVHPHDLPNKAKLGFLEAYEPGWASLQQDIQLSLLKLDRPVDRI
ncbi:uncharacterized protein LOC141827524 isoform X1 [Curcuma longa]|uniref:uncharacterized protein LOC141827524 isoform X1 n=2 Tax=Curcuma longa TaxID=136217 RepID=UPI003D9F6358